MAPEAPEIATMFRFIPPRFRIVLWQRQVRAFALRLQHRVRVVAMSEDELTKDMAALIREAPRTWKEILQH